jgi:heme-degrading monooxygenase HmoA
MTNNPRQKVHALWLFDVDDVDGAIEYFKFAIPKLPAMGMKPISIGRYRSTHVGDVTPRQFYVLGEWDSEEAFQNFAQGADHVSVHETREDSTSNTSRQFFDGIFMDHPDFRFEDLVALFKP